jgi:hypothetical protein
VRDVEDIDGNGNGMGNGHVSESKSIHWQFALGGDGFGEALQGVENRRATRLLLARHVLLLAFFIRL